jgi:hypothetical protein
MEDDEPLRQLSREEFDTLRAEILASREAAQPTSTPPTSTSSPPSPPNPQAMETGYEIWQMRKRGLSRFEISRRLSIPMEAVTKILGEFEHQFYPDISASIQHHASLDLERLETLIGTWLPTAVSGPLQVTRVDKHGAVSNEWDAEVPLNAAATIVAAIRTRTQILAALRPEVTNGKDSSSTNTLIWLQQALPGVQKVVGQIDGNGASRTIEMVEAEVDIKSTNGSPR